MPNKYSQKHTETIFSRYTRVR